MSTELFKVEGLKLNESLLPSEQILTLDGFHSNIFIGTNFGRLCHFKLVENTWKLEKILPTIKQTPIEQVIVTTALGYIMIVSDKTLYFIDIDMYQIVSSSGEGHVGRIVLNMDPVTDNPFILQIAIVVSSKEIWVCEKFEDNFDTKHQISVASPVLAMYYSRYCLCYATDREYFVRDLLNKVTISLFPFENTVMYPNITGVGSEEVMLSGMQGLVIFANKEGVSSRPPIFVGSGSIRSFSFVSPFIYVLTDVGLNIYNIDSQQLNQTIPVESFKFLSNIDGTIFLVRENGLSFVSQIVWSQQVEEKMKENVKDALSLAKELLVSNSLEKNYSAMQKFKEFQARAAFTYLEEGKEEEAFDLLIESESNPQKVIDLVDDLILSQRNEDSEKSKKISLELVETYLSKIRSADWADSYHQSIDAALARIFVLNGKISDISKLENTDWNDEHYRKWLQSINHFNLAAELAFDSCSYEEAFTIWKKLAEKQIEDPLFDVNLCFDRLKQVDAVRLWNEILSWLTPIDPERSMEAVINFDRLSADEVLSLFDSYPIVQLRYLCHIVSNPELCNRCSLSTKQLHVKLFQLYINELKVLNASNLNSGKYEEIRRQLHRFIFDFDLGDIDELLQLIGNDKSLAVESLLLQARRGNPTEIMKMLVHMDLNAAELLCTSLPTFSSSLLPILLNAYTKRDKTNEDIRKRIGTILSKLDSSINAKEVLQDLPQDMNCSEVCDFLKRSLAHSHNQIASNRMRACIEQKIMKDLENQLSRTAYDSFIVNEDTMCKHCAQPIGKEDIVLYPTSRNLAHTSCHMIYGSRDESF